MTIATETTLLTPEWHAMFYHETQRRLVESPARFKVVAAGRRSGKTDLAIRCGILEAFQHTDYIDAWFVFAAPTRDQAKQIFWRWLKKMIPRDLMMKDPMESELTITLINGTHIRVVGMDKPARVEGIAITWFCLDEYASMKPEAWERSIGPATSTRGKPGKGWFIGKPVGRNHFYDLFKHAQDPENMEWEAFHWPSASVLTSEEIDSAKSRMDEQSYLQEYEASFINMTGRAYYPFTRETHAVERLEYNPDLPLIFCFDFNISPGVCAVIQEQAYEGARTDVAEEITAVIGEVYIPKNSSTPKVCRKLQADYGTHKGEVLAYGDATGGAGGTAKVAGSDWDLIENALTKTFDERFYLNVPKGNPRERVRVNSVNSRLMTADDKIHLLVDPKNAPNVVDDFEGVSLLEGGSGEIDKKSGDKLTHLTDAIGYYIQKEFPFHEYASAISEVF